MEETKKQKTIYDLKLHETLLVEEKIISEYTDAMNAKRENESIKKYEVTRVAGGWVYAFEYPGFRQSPIVFVPFSNDFMDLNIKGK